MQLSRDPDLWKHVVFVEDYDMKVGREMVQGVDLWLNNPRRGEEACGTSGMKAAHERRAQPEHSGWLVRRGLRDTPAAGPSASASRTPRIRTRCTPAPFYYLLENEIVPMFYERREQTPREWVRRMKQSLTYISPQFDCRRMVREYMTELYEPAHQQHVRIRDSRYARGARKVAMERAHPRSVGQGEVRGVRSQSPPARWSAASPSACAPPSTLPASRPKTCAWKW